MSLLTQISLNAAVYGDAAKESNKFSIKISDKTLDIFNLESSYRVQLAASATNTAVAFQSVTNGQLIVLRSDKAFTVRINGIGNPEISLKPRTSASEGITTPAFLVMLADAVTSMHLSNPGAESTQIDVGIAGV